MKKYVIVLLIGMMWGCGGDHPTTPKMTKADGQMGRPLSKLAVPQQTVVWATLRRNSTPVSGAILEFARSVAGQIGLELQMLMGGQAWRSHRTM